MRTETSHHPTGPIAKAIELLQTLQALDCAEAVRLLWMDRIECRETLAEVEELCRRARDPSLIPPPQ